MRIVMAAPFLGEAFGQERVLSASCNLLSEAGHSVYLLGDKQVGPLPRVEGLLLVPGISQLHSLSAYAEVSAKHQAVRQYMEGVRPDIVHLHDGFDYRLLAYLTRNYATLGTAHTLAPTCPSSDRFTNQPSPCDSKSGWGCIPRSRKKGCLAFYKSDLHRIHSVHGFVLKRRILRSHLKAIFAVSRYVEETLLLDGWASEKIRRVPNPVFEPNLKRTPSPSTLFVFAARMTQLKGPQVFLRALKQIEDRAWNAKFCGEGADREKCEKLSRALGLESRVEFLGQTDSGTTQMLLAKATAVVAPNLGAETHGMTVAEACALATPVICASVPALTEIIDDRTGYLFPPRNVEALAARLIEVIDNPIEAQGRADRARAKVLQEYSPRKHLAETLSAYRWALDSRPFSFPLSWQPAN